MTTYLLAFALLSRQNPNPPDVSLPPGWGTTYRSHGGFLTGPKGEEIRFPAYGSSGEGAADLSKADSKAFFATFVLGGRPIDVALARDGRLVASYHRVLPPMHSAYASFDYWTKVKTARQAAGALLIVLTRIEPRNEPTYGARDKITPFTPTPLPPSAGGERFPGYVQLPPKYVYRPRLEDDLRGGRFVGPGDPMIEYRPDLTRTKGPSPADPAQRVKWKISRTILGRNINVAEGEKGGLAVWTTAPEKPGPFAFFPIFGTRDASPKAAVVLILTRLSFSATEG